MSPSKANTLLRTSRWPILYKQIIAVIKPLLYKTINWEEFNNTELRIEMVKLKNIFNIFLRIKKRCITGYVNK